MVLFGAYSTAERFLDEDRLTAHFPGPGSYPSKSAVEGAPVPRYARKLVEDGVVRPDGSAILFRERDGWVRGVEGPKVLLCKSFRTAMGRVRERNVFSTRCWMFDVSFNSKIRTNTDVQQDGHPTLYM